MAITEIAGFAGAGLARAAYVPQISHLIRARCSAGISRLARAWFLAFGRWGARAQATERCANVGVHTFGRVPDVNWRG